MESYPLSHASELAGFELIARGFLESEHEKLALEIYNLFVDFFGGLGSDLLQLFLSLRHHLHGGRGIPPERRRRRRLDSDSLERGFGVVATRPF